MNWLKIIMTYLPYVLQGVVAVEAAIKGAPGASKKQVVLDAITAGASVGETVPQQEVSGISTLIDVVVGTLNTTGVFTKLSPAA